MESTFYNLGQLLLKAVPTIFFLLVVHFYLKWMFFRPMARILAERRASTEGVRESAAALRATADEKAKSIEAQLRQAREAIYAEQEEARRRWSTEQGAQLEEARKQARELVHQSKQQLDAESEAAQGQLAGTAGALADQIVDALLERTPA